MSSNRGAWIRRRGQVGAEAAIDQVIDRQPQLGEQVQQVADELIEDSPYQTRRPFSDESIEDLAQGMHETGFQGALRPDTTDAAEQQPRELAMTMRAYDDHVATLVRDNVQDRWRGRPLINWVSIGTRSPTSLIPHVAFNRSSQKARADSLCPAR